MPTNQSQWGGTQYQWSRNALARASTFVVASTLALTASFLGVVGLLSGDVTGLGSRLPVYVLVMALAFVAAIITFEQQYHEAVQILAFSAIAGVLTFLLATFGGEGVAFLAQNHQEIVASHLLFYLVAAGLIGTGIGYWTLNHWSELRWAGSQL